MQGLLLCSWVFFMVQTFEYNRILWTSKPQTNIKPLSCLICHKLIEHFWGDVPGWLHVVCYRYSFCYWNLVEKGKWHLMLVKVGVELGCGENLCLKEAFYLILDRLFLRERLSQKFLLIFICLLWMDEGNWSNMTFWSMTYFNAYAGMKSMMTCINLRID